jgi:hypothetical protein
LLPFVQACADPFSGEDSIALGGQGAVTEGWSKLTRYLTTSQYGLFWLQLNLLDFRLGVGLFLFRVSTLFMLHHSTSIVAFIAKFMP